MPVRIRPLRLSDYEDIIGIFDVCGLHPKTRGRDSRANIAKQLRSNRALYLGAFNGSRLVGTVFGTHDTRKGWINRLAVLPEYRRRGLAARLVRMCERALHEEGLEMYAALIDADNVASRSLFTKLGYEDRDIRYYSRKERDEV